MSEYLEKKIAEEVNVAPPDKCACCTYMFNYKCRADKCPYETKDEDE